MGLITGATAFCRTHARRIVGVMASTLHDKEGRVVLSPDAVNELRQNHGYRFLVQLSPIRCFPSVQYRMAGAEVVTELGGRPDIYFSIKQIPPDFFRPGKAYVFFSHTHKGQPGNMHMLQTMMRRGSTLIDYERMVDDEGVRVIAFSRFAGMAGVTDTLHLLGKRLAAESEALMANPFSDMRQAYQYRGGVEEIRTQLCEIGSRIRSEGLPEEMPPLVIGFLGYGRVIQGALEVFDALSPREITPEELLRDAGSLSRREIYKVIFKECDSVKPKDPSAEFDLQDYYAHPERYSADMAKYLPRLTALVNGIYWESKYPVLISKEDLQNLMQMGAGNHLKAIGDISCDIDGAIKSTIKETTVNDPYYIYNPGDGSHNMGWRGEGVAVNALGTSPCELAREASVYFSNRLMPYVPGIVEGSYWAPYNPGIHSLPEPVQRAVILWRGELTPPYRDNLAILKGLIRYGNRPFHHDW